MSQDFFVRHKFCVSSANCEVCSLSNCCNSTDSIDTLILGCGNLLALTKPIIIFFPGEPESKWKGLAGLRK